MTKQKIKRDPVVAAKAMMDIFIKRSESSAHPKNTTTNKKLTKGKR